MGSLVAQLRACIATIGARVAGETNVYLTSGFSTGGKVSVTGNVAASGAVSGSNLSTPGGATVNGPMSSVGIYNTDVSLLDCSWQPIRQNNAGPVGYAPSSMVSGQNHEARHNTQQAPTYHLRLLVKLCR